MESQSVISDFPIYLLEAVINVRQKGSAFIPYKLEDERYYDEIGKLMCIHYSYCKVMSPQFTVQIWQGRFTETSGKTSDERMNAWCFDIKQKFDKYKKGLVRKHISG